MSLSFQGGTLVLYDIDENAAVPDTFQWTRGVGVVKVTTTQLQQAG